MKRKLRLEEGDVNIIINALICLRNQLIKEGKYHDAVDDIILYLCKYA